MSRANPTRLSSLKGKEKDASKTNFSIYTAPLRPKTQRHLEDRELNQARSKSNTVDQPVKIIIIIITDLYSARIFVHHCNSTQYCSTETVFIYIPLPPDQHHISDVANCRQGGIANIVIRKHCKRSKNISPATAEHDKNDSRRKL